MSSTHFATCTLCEAICGIVVETHGNSVASIRGDTDDPFSRGHICPKAAALKDLHEDPDRRRRPLRREGDTWHEMDWDEAFDLVAQKIREIQAQHGRDSVAFYQGNPTVHSIGTMLTSPAFARALRTKNKFSATSLDQLPQMLAAWAMFGHQFFLPIPDLDRTDYLLIFGANPVVSNGSLMTAPDVARRLKEIVSRGGRVVVVDPRRTETSKIASEHVFIRPGRDALVLMAMIHTLFEEELISTGHLSPYLVGVREIREAASGFAPERVAAESGIDADTIKRLARELARADRAVCYGRVGLCTQEAGGLAAWLLNVLNVLTGRLDVPGGAMFTKPAIDVVGQNLIGKGHFGRYQSRVRGLPEFGGELPTVVLAEEIETPGEGQIRALVTSSGNPVLSSPNGQRLDRALASLDFMVSIDIYVNETTRHAHVILPPTGPLERDHYDAAFHAIAIRNTARYSQAVFKAPEGTRHDYQIFTELTRRLRKNKGPLASVQARATDLAVQRLGPRGFIDLGLRMGPYGSRLSPFSRGLSVRHLVNNPHGVDLGPLEPCLPGRLPKKDGRIHLAPAIFVENLHQLESFVREPPPENGQELVLIGRRTLRSNNSWMHNSLRLVKGPPRCTLRMTKKDASDRELAQGDRVRVTSRVGSVEVDLDISDEMMPGVVSLPHGFGHNREGARLAVAAKHAGASVNDLTDEEFYDPVSGVAAFSGVPVTVEKAT